MMRVGVHWPEAGRRYPDGTPFVELVYLDGVAPDDPHHRSQAMRRIEALAERHPESEVLLRVDWRQGQAYARTDDERTAYRAALGELSRLGHLGGRLVLQPGNEPQLEGARGWRLVEGALREFIAQCQQALPGVRLASVPVATFHPNRLGARAGQSPEGSPWADLDYALLNAWKRIAGPPDVLSVHVYGNPRLAVADDMRTRHEQGWRFGLNVAETWAENHAALGLDHLPVWITEFNTAARGTDRPHRPAVNYQAGWLQDAVPVVAKALPHARALCWFVGQERGGHWHDFAPAAHAELERDLETAMAAPKGRAGPSRTPEPAPMPHALTPPLDGTIRVTSGFGVDRGSYRHGGLDLALAAGSVYRRPVRAPAGGVVAAVWTTERASTRDAAVRDGFPYGNAVALRDGEGVLWRYLHFDEPPRLVVGDLVEPGETLGLCDSSGNSTGHHVHLDATPGGRIDPETFRVTGERVNPLELFADGYARAVGYDTQVFRRQIVMESGWNPAAVSRAGAEGIAQIIPRWHPSMRGRTFDPFASLEYAANLMASHIAHRGGDYREALADYNTGRASRGTFRDEGYRYADWILKGLDMATSRELDDLRADRDRNHDRKLAALHHVGELVQAARRAGERAFRPEDWRAVVTAERFYHDPEGAREG